MLFVAGLMASLAWGQGASDFAVSPVVLLDGGDLIGAWPGSTGGVGSPSVTVHEPYDDPTADILLMTYETQYEAPSALCPAGRWGVGLAFRTAGSNFVSLTDAGPIILPDPGSYYSCVAAHPTIVQLSDGAATLQQAWLIYFKAEQECAATDPSCDRYQGLGQLVIRYSDFDSVLSQYNYVLEGPNTTPVLTGVAQDMGYPKAAFVDGEYRIAFGQFPDVYLASSGLVDDFPTPTTPALTAGTPTGWGDDEVYSPAILCDGNSLLKMYPVGRSWDVTATMLNDVAVGRFDSTNPANDFDVFTEINTSPFLSTADGDDEVRHLHMASSHNVDRYAMYFSSPDNAGDNEIRIATTNLYRWRRTDPRRCP